MWVRSKQFKRVLGLSNQALYQRRKRSTVEYKIANGVYFYWLQQDFSQSKMNIIYCRVSNTKQKEDLQRQQQILKQYAISNGFKIDKVLKQIASGMNQNRSQFNQLINLVVNRKVNKIFISFKDRLTRFGYNYFQYLFRLFGVQIEVVNLTKEEDFQSELTQDLISIIHHFSMKMYSNRRKQLNTLKKALQSENDQTTV